MLLDAALEFGTNWRRDLRELADERLADLDHQTRLKLAEQIEAARSAIESWILQRWDANGGTWSRADSRAARDFIVTAYPWINERNVSHAVRQGTYYAWRG